ncbi:unnamed protein product [Symbiodinium natans]|uniref:Ubiquitin-like domain-containing protein n=1 Tax=Symbiodinium natans TaxID=878477 RepID=A0A812LU84_9DINO|nr:unnamed protein product [Symbiodinium natans]
MVTVHVSLLSGREVSLEADPEESLTVLRERAEKRLSVKEGRLLDSSGMVLEGSQSIKKSKLENGATLTLVRRPVKVSMSLNRIAVIRCDGSVVTLLSSLRHGWVNVGDGSFATDQLSDVVEVHAGCKGYAALKGDGSVVFRGAHPPVCYENIRMVQTTTTDYDSGPGFAAIVKDGSVVTWPIQPDETQQEELRNISQVQDSAQGFLAIRRDGRVVPIGWDVEDRAAVPGHLQNVSTYRSPALDNLREWHLLPSSAMEAS